MPSLLVAFLASFAFLQPLQSSFAFFFRRRCNHRALTRRCGDPGLCVRFFQAHSSNPTSSLTQGSHPKGVAIQAPALAPFGRRCEHSALTRRCGGPGLCVRFFQAHPSFNPHLVPNTGLSPEGVAIQAPVLASSKLPLFPTNLFSITGHSPEGVEVQAPVSFFRFQTPQDPTHPGLSLPGVAIQSPVSTRRSTSFSKSETALNTFDFVSSCTLSSSGNPVAPAGHFRSCNGSRPYLDGPLLRCSFPAFHFPYQVIPAISSSTHPQRRKGVPETK